MAGPHHKAQPPNLEQPRMNDLPGPRQRAPSATRPFRRFQADAEQTRNGARISPRSGRRLLSATRQQEAYRPAVTCALGVDQRELQSVTRFPARRRAERLCWLHGLFGRLCTDHPVMAGRRARRLGVLPIVALMAIALCRSPRGRTGATNSRPLPEGCLHAKFVNQKLAIDF